MSNNGEKSSTTNGLAPDPQQRLASLKPTRDLTLGGVKPNKKVFTPNLNVARNKNKGPNLNSARDQKRDDKGKRDRKNDKNRNIKNGPNVIKSSGVFSEGLGAVERQSGRFGSYGGRDGGGAPAATLQKPTLRVRDFVKVDKDLEEQKIRRVMGQDSPEDDEYEDLKQVAEKDAPIKLPMDTGVATVPAPIVKKEVFEENDVVNLLKNDQPTLILLQLPDSLPGRGSGGGEPEPSTSGSGDNKEEVTPTDGRCRMSDLEEGRVGKLRVHASGRVTLALGDTIFEVSTGTKAAFYQEAVSVATDDSSRSANLISLGPLLHKLNLTPDWEAMFQDMPV
ncbi:DNA-directed RNA polymerase III subunit RPC4 isoform X2 [Leguminivora glycinivorella]|uniref:DNA-directed RNA polymerase III subunit RPC4 isoform X2 n=1 Tax=Leguminivora glycinivorella TaxID=1035111 RepID=UPI00200BC08B|nr:DNA-directed RNA polymerase III subunit RPC4 isoform X2 [Leguminivora glycinivorella]